MLTSNKNLRLNQLVELLKNRESMLRSEIAEELGVSAITVSRDINALRQKGYKICCKNDSYYIVSEPISDLTETNFSLVQFRLIHLIKTISKASDHIISEEDIVKKFVNNVNAMEEKKSKITKKTLMKNLQILQEKGLILKEKNKENQVFYKLVEANLNNGFSVDTCVKLIKYIRGNIGPLPYNEDFTSIAGKLENGVVRSLSRYDCFSREEVIRELGTSYKLFSSGLDNDVEDSEEVLLSELDRLCSENLFAQIWLKGKAKPIRHFCIMTVFQISLDRWYLVVKTSGKERNFGLIRVNNIERVEEVCDVKCDIAMKQRLEVAKQQAYDEIVDSFGMGLGGKTRVKIRIRPDRDILDSVLLRLENVLCSELGQAEDGSLILIAEVDGISDFLHWVRGFGSGIMIVEPEFVRKMQHEETHRLLEAYREAQYV